MRVLVVSSYVMNSDIFKIVNVKRPDYIQFMLLANVSPIETLVSLITRINIISLLPCESYILSK